MPSKSYLNADGFLGRAIQLLVFIAAQLTFSFEETVANAAILRLHTAALWAEVSQSRPGALHPADNQEMKATRASLRTGDYNDFDLGFQAEMDNHIGLAYANFERSGCHTDLGLPWS